MYIGATLNYVIVSTCVYVFCFCSSSSSLPTLLCSASCEGDEDELRECNIVYVVTSGQACSCGGDVVGISCSKYNLPAKILYPVIM